jgi:hypothetical protein
MYNFDGVRKMLGQSSGQSLEDRGVLELEKKVSWIANGLEAPFMELYMRDFADLMGPGLKGSYENATAVLWQGSAYVPSNTPYIAPDLMYIWLFQEIVTTGGSVAFALQAMITVL